MSTIWAFGTIKNKHSLYRGEDKILMIFFAAKTRCLSL